PDRHFVGRGNTVDGERDDTRVRCRGLHLSLIGGPRELECHQAVVTSLIRPVLARLVSKLARATFPPREPPTEGRGTGVIPKNPRFVPVCARLPCKVAVPLAVSAATDVVPAVTVNPPASISNAGVPPASRSPTFDAEPPLGVLM